MKKFSLKALGASLLTLGLVLVGAAAPAQAATMTSPSATSTGTIGTSGTNSSPITVTATTVSPAANDNSKFVVALPSGWTFVTPFDAQRCNQTLSVSGMQTTAQCQTTNGSPSKATLFNSVDGDEPTAITQGTTISITFATGSLNVSAERTFTISTETGNGLTVVDSATATLVGGSAPSPSPGVPSASITLGAAQGQLVAGSSVAIVASGLQATAPYTVVVRSTPQTIGTGNAVSGAVNTSVTLPSNLGAGWHTLTFSSTASDGSPMTSVLYFEVSSTGTLLATSSTKPAALANTGFDAVPFIASGVALMILGAGVMLVARRKNA